MIKLLKRTNPRKLLLVFHSFANPYKTLILARDESFLLKHNFNDIAQKGGNLSYAESIITQLKEHWAENKDPKEIKRFFKRIF